MNKDKYVFAQLVSFLDNFKFRRIVAKYDGDRYVKSYTCWKQLLTMIFGQLSGRESLRDLVVAMEAHSGKLYHLGMGKSVIRSNLAKANESRDYRIFEEFATFIIEQARTKRKSDIFRGCFEFTTLVLSNSAPVLFSPSSVAVGIPTPPSPCKKIPRSEPEIPSMAKFKQPLKLGGSIYAFDSTTIGLCLSVFWWAKFRKKKGGIKMHTLYDIETRIPAFVHITPASVHDTKTMPQIPYEREAYYIFDRGYNDFGNLETINRIEAYFVLRAKRNLRVKVVKWKRRLPVGVVSDSVVEFVIPKSAKVYPERLRRVVFFDAGTKTEYVFLTNDMRTPALMIAQLYRNRWSVELFFKWIKSHLKIKRFWGETENAVRIQIYCAIITYCLVAIIQHDMELERSIYEVLQILSISLTDKTHLRDLFDKSNLNYLKEPYDSGVPNLFNF